MWDRTESPRASSRPKFLGRRRRSHAERARLHLAPPDALEDRALLAPIDDLGNGLRRLADTSLIDVLRVELPALGEALGNALENRDAAGNSQGPGLIRRLLESNGVALSQIGTGQAIDTVAELASALNAPAAGLTATAEEMATTATIELSIIKILGGAPAELGGTTLGGLIEFDATAALSAQVNLNLVFGADAAGFFIATEESSAPELVIDQVRGSLGGSARLGFLGMEIVPRAGNQPQLQTAPGAKIVVDLVDPATNTGTASIDKIRLEELPGGLASLVTTAAIVDLQGDPADDLTATLEFAIGGGAQNFANVTLDFRWADLLDPNTVDVHVSAQNANPHAQKVLDLLDDIDVSEVVDTITSVAAAVQQVTGHSILDARIPVLDLTVGELLEGPARDLALTPGRFAGITDLGIRDDERRFAVLLADGQKAADLGLRIGQVVRYVTAAGAQAEATIGALDFDPATGRDLFELVQAATNAQLPNLSDPQFRVGQIGSIADRLLALKDRLRGDLPTLQSVLARVSEALGINLTTLKFDTSQANNPRFLLPIDFAPDPIRFDRRLEIATPELDGLALQAGADFVASVAPQFHFDLGVALGAGVPLADRIFLTGRNGQNEFSLDVDVAVPTIDATGRLGFLDVRLTGGGPALGLDATITANITDPSVTPVELVMIPFAQLFNPTVDASFTLSPLTLQGRLGAAGPVIGSVVLDLESGPTVPIDSVAMVQDLVDGLRVTGNLSSLERFQTFGPQEVLDALQLIVAQLDQLGTGSVFSRPLPIVNKSISEILDGAIGFGDALLAELGPDGLNVSSAVAASAGTLESFLESRLPGIDVQFQARANNDVVMTFTISPDLPSRTLPLAFEVGGRSLASLTGAGDLTLSLTPTFAVGLGIRTGTLTPGESFLDRFFLDPSTQLTVIAAANAGFDVNGDGVLDNEGNPIDLAATLGPFAIGVDRARALLGLTASAKIKGDGQGRLKLRDLSTHLGNGAFGSIFDAANTGINGSVQALIPLDGAADPNRVVAVPLDPSRTREGLVQLAGRFQLGADAPFGVQTGANVGLDDRINAAGAAAPLTSQQLNAFAINKLHIETQNLEGVLAGLLNFKSLSQGLQQFLAWGSDLLGVDLLDAKIPFLGKSIGEAFEFFDTLKPNSIGGIVKSLIESQLVNQPPSAAVLRQTASTFGLLLKNAGLRAILPAPFPATMTTFVGDFFTITGAGQFNQVALPLQPGSFGTLNTTTTGTFNVQLSQGQSAPSFVDLGLSLGDLLSYRTTGGQQAQGRIVEFLTGGYNIRVRPIVPTGSTLASRAPDTASAAFMSAFGLVPAVVSNVEFQGKFNPGVDAALFSGPLSFGLDFFEIDVELNPTFLGNFDVSLGFGIDREDGFYIKTDFAQPEIQLTGGFELDGLATLRLGPLAFQANFNESSGVLEDDKLTAGLTIDLKGRLGTTNPNDPAQVRDAARLTVGELLDLPNLLQRAVTNLIFDAGMNAHLKLGVPTLDGKLPEIEADLSFRYADADIQAADGLETKQHPRLTNIQVDVGSVLTRAFQPILEKLEAFKIIPSQVRDLLTKKIPVIEKTGAELLKEIPGLSTAQRRQLDSLINLLSLVDRITSEATSAGNMVVKYQNASIGINPESEAAEAANDRPSIAATPNAAGTIDDSPNGQDGASVPGNAAVPGSNFPLVGDFITQLNDDFNVAFPIFRFPELVALLTGGEADLVLFNFDDLELELDLNQRIPIVAVGLPGVLSVQASLVFGGRLTLQANLAAGLDTRGLRTGKFLDGIYFGDRDPNGLIPDGTSGDNFLIEPTDPEKPEFQVTAGIDIGVEGSVTALGITGFINAVGDITGTITVDLNDENMTEDGLFLDDGRPLEDHTDGKLHLDEIGTIHQFYGGQFEDLLCIFTGTFGVDGGITVTAGVRNLPWPFPDTIEVEILRRTFTIVPTMTLRCDPPPGAGTIGTGDPDAGGEPGVNFDNAGFLADVVLVTGLMPGQPVARDLLLTRSNSSSDRTAAAATNHPDGDVIDVAFEDVNGDKLDGPEVLTIPTGGGGAVVNTTGSTFTLTDPNASYLTAGVEPGQFATYPVSGNPIPVRVVSVTPTTIVFDKVVSAIPSPSNSATVTVRSGKEVIRVSKDGFTDRFLWDPTITRIRVDRASLADSTRTLGAGDDIVTIDPLFRGQVVLDGGAGDDRIVGGSGRNTLMGGSGDDDLSLPLAPRNLSAAQRAERASRLEGGTGDDLLIAGSGNDMVLGGLGDDTIDGGAAGHRLPDGATAIAELGASGDDTLIGGGDDDFIDGRSGNDLIVGDYAEGFDPRPTTGRAEGSDLLSGDEGHDVVFGDNRGTVADQDGPAAGADRPTADTIFAGIGNDLIFAGTDDDVVMADPEGPGTPAIAGLDTIFGGSGRDRLLGGRGADRIVGNIGDDILIGGFDDDLIFGGDAVAPGSGPRLPDRDLIFGDDGRDFIDLTTIGNGRVYAGTGNDTVLGSPGADLIRGEANDDTLLGGPATDRLFGGAGINKVLGGVGTVGGISYPTTAATTIGRDVIVSETPAADLVLPGNGSIDMNNTELRPSGPFRIGGRLQGNLTLSNTNAFEASLSRPRILFGLPFNNATTVRGTVALNSAPLSVSFKYPTSVGDEVALILNDGTDAVVGTFANRAEGSTSVIGGVTYRISYRGGDGNDVTLTHINTPPRFPERSITARVEEGGIAVLSGVITEADPLDTFTLEVDWGDGTPVEVLTFGPERQGEWIRVEHRYAESRGTDPIPVRLRWSDPNGGFNTGELAVEVVDAAPQLAAQALDSAREGQPTRVVGLVRDPADALTLIIDWGDGSAPERLTFGPGSSSFDATHVYPVGGRYPIQVTAEDDDGARTVARLGTDVGYRSRDRLRVGELYRTLVSLPPDAATLNRLAARLGRGIGLNRIAGLILGSPATRSRATSALIEHHFGRAATNAEVAQYGAILVRTRSALATRLAIVTGDAYYEARGGGTNAGYVAALVADSGQEVAADRIAQFVASLDGGTARRRIAAEFWTR